MKYYLIAGEASGDLHGSNLVKHLRRLDTEANLRGWGGDKMQAAGVDLQKHYSELAFMGFVEVIANLPTILRNLRICKSDIQSFQPDLLVLIDYPGFNLRIAEWARQQGIKVCYYISPQVWAWKENRVHKMRKTIDELLVILPFEKQYFKNKWNWDVTDTGHPLLPVVEEYAGTQTTDASTPIVALLPGSRKQEINTSLPIMLEVAAKFPGYEFVVAMAPSIPASFYNEWIGQSKNVSAKANSTYNILSSARAALVTSGTATLETALFKVPQVVCYKGSAISYAIARRLVSIKYISLVNLIMDRQVVPELIQHEFTAEHAGAHLKSLLEEGDVRTSMLEGYEALHQLLSTGENASEVAAKKVFALARTSAKVL